MAFALGVAIYNEFQRIAELLAMRNLGVPPGSSGGGGSSGTPPPGGTGPGGSPSSPPPPGTGTPSAPIPPPVFVDLPWDNVFAAPPPQAPVCPLFAPSDYLSLLTMQQQAQAHGGVVIPPYIFPGQEQHPVGNSFGLGIPVEATDFFRFRAYGTAPATPVSFFGRVQRSDGVIVPFNHALTTNATGTVFQSEPATGAGILLGAAASVPIGSITSGAVFAIGEIGRLAGTDFTPHTLLFSGQLNDQQPLSSTLASPSPPVNNPTYFQVSSAGPSAVNLDITITPTSGKKARVMFFSSLLTAGGGGTARGVGASFRTGGTAKWFTHANLLLPVGAFAGWVGAIGGSIGAQTPAGGGLTYPFNTQLPDNMYFNEPFIVRNNLENGGAGDSVASLFVAYEET